MLLKVHASVIVGEREGIPISWCGGSPEKTLQKISTMRIMDDAIINA